MSRSRTQRLGRWFLEQVVEIFLTVFWKLAICAAGGLLAGIGVGLSGGVALGVATFVLVTALLFLLWIGLADHLF